MLATPGALPVGPEWLYEVMWDGIRVLAEVRTDDDGAIRLRLSTRAGRDVTANFPELADLGAALPDVVLDGEIMLLDRGVPSFAALSGRLQGIVPAAVAAARPATYMVSDVLRLYGVELAGRSLADRRATLERLDLTAAPAVAVSPAYTDGPALLAATAQQCMQGVVAKRRTDPYEPGVRSPGWVAVAHRRATTCVVGGWKAGRGRIEALLLGIPDGHRGTAARGAGGVDGLSLRYVGRAEIGLGSAALQRAVQLRLVPAAAPPFRDPLPRSAATGARWCAPGLVVEVGHEGERPDGRLSGIVLRGIRDDVSPDGVGGA